MSATDAETNGLKAQSLFSKTSKLEKELASSLKKKPPVEKRVTALRARIRENYERILFLDIEYATKQDVDQLLWKTVFYKHIEEFRKLIKKCHATAYSAEATPQSKEQLHAVCSSFRSFLEESSAYYESLYQKMKSHYNVNEAENTIRSSQSGDASVLKCAVLSLHKILIVLGDLARYRELYNESHTKDWSAARAFYFRALELQPTNGNPHNQLAVLATYQEDECEAIYRYFRSLAVKKPFISARDNLTLLFEKNRQKLQTLGTNKSVKQRGKKDKSLKNDDILQSFLTRFVRLHGIIFTKTSLETFKDTLSEAMRDLIAYMHKVSLPADLPLKMTVMNIFTLENINWTRDGYEPTAAEIAQRPVLLAHGLSMAFAFASRFARTMAKCGHLYLLGSVVTFLQWLRSRRELVNNSQNQENHEEQFNMWNDIADLLNSGRLHIPENKKDQLRSASLPPLPEDMELLGFLPLDNTAGTYSENKYNCDITLTQPFADLDLYRRIERLKDIVQSALNGDHPDLYYDADLNQYSAQPFVKQQLASGRITADEQEEQPQEQDERIADDDSFAEGQFEDEDIEHVENGHVVNTAPVITVNGGTNRYDFAKQAASAAISPAANTKQSFETNPQPQQGDQEEFVADDEDEEEEVILWPQLTNSSGEKDTNNRKVKSEQVIDSPFMRTSTGSSSAFNEAPAWGNSRTVSESPFGSNFFLFGQQQQQQPKPNAFADISAASATNSSLFSGPMDYNRSAWNGPSASAFPQPHQQQLLQQNGLLLPSAFPTAPNTTSGLGSASMFSPHINTNNVWEPSQAELSSYSNQSKFSIAPGGGRIIERPFQPMNTAAPHQQSAPSSMGGAPNFLPSWSQFNNNMMLARQQFQPQPQPQHRFNPYQAAAAGSIGGFAQQQQQSSNVDIAFSPFGFPSFGSPNANNTTSSNNIKTRNPFIT